MSEKAQESNTRSVKGTARFLTGLEWRPLVVPFLLSTVLGGALTTWFQYLSSQRTLRESQRDAEIKGATEVFNDVSRSLDKRLYRTRRLLWAYKGKRESGTAGPGKHTEWDAEISSRRASYMESVQSWNESLNRTYALTDLYFGERMRNYLEQFVAGGFRCISDELREDADDLPGLEKRIDSFNPAIYQLNIEMLRRIQNGVVGRRAAANEPLAVQSGSSPCVVVSAKSGAR